jgi:hypothetical protein
MAVFGNVMMVFNQKPLIPLDKLFSYYRFDNNFLDQRATNNASGTNVAFQASPKRAGTHSAKFDSGTGNPTATPSYATIPYSSDFDFGNGTTDRAFSISFWIFPTIESTATPRFFINKRDQDLNVEIQITNNSNDGFRFLIANDERPTGGALRFLSAFNTAAYTINTWQMVTATYDGSLGINIYVNEAEKTSTLNTNSFTLIKTYAQDITIGVAGWTKTNSGFSYKGNMDCLGFWNAELTPEQIGLMYQKGLNNLELI